MPRSCAFVPGISSRRVRLRLAFRNPGRLLRRAAVMGRLEQMLREKFPQFLPLLLRPRRRIQRHRQQVHHELLLQRVPRSHGLRLGRPGLAPWPPTSPHAPCGKTIFGASPLGEILMSSGSDPAAADVRTSTTQPAGADAAERTCEGECADGRPERQPTPQAAG